MDSLANLTLRQLRAFAATLSSGSQTIAAQTLGVTQPAITLQLQNLQDLAGLPLLQRTPEGPVATDAGRALIELDGRIKLALEDCIQALRAIKGLSGGRVAIGAVSTAKYFAAELIAAFLRQHEGIDLKLVVGNRAETVESLRNYDIDVAVMGRPPSDFEIGRAHV